MCAVRRRKLARKDAGTARRIDFVRAARWDEPGITDERGMTTAEYAVGTVAAVGFAGLLVALLSSDEVRELLMNIVRSALGTFG